MSLGFHLLAVTALSTTLLWGQPAFIVRDIRPGSQDAIPVYDLAREPRLLAGLGDKLLFFAQDGGGGIDLWETDGSFTGTRKVKDFSSACRVTNRAHSLCFPLDLAASGGKVFFANADEHGVELWATDGTDAGTALVKDLNPSGDSLFVGGETTNYWNSLTDVDGTLFLSAQPPGIWTSDGTSGGTSKVRDLPGSGCFPDLAEHLVNRDGELVFMIRCPSKELWRSDGTAPGTRVVKAFSGAIFGPIVVVNRLAFFVADDGQGGELWAYDGSSARLVKDIVPGPGSPVIQTETLRAVNGSLYFHDKDRNLWKSNGTAAGTVRASEIFPGFPGFIPDEVVEVGGTIYFPAEGLWASDGTPEGTRMVQEEGASNLTVAGGILYFVSGDLVHGTELWALHVSDQCDADVIVDNGSAGTSFTGQWRVSEAPRPFGPDSLWSRVNSSLVPAYRFQADLAPGAYEVLEWHSSLASRSRSARHVISHDGGATSVLVDQSIGPGRWNSLGTYDFSGPGAVTIRAEDSERSTNADAIRFLCAAPGRPVAVIEGIAPRPALAGKKVCLEGHGEGSLPIVAHEWLSSLQPGVLLSVEEDFCRTDLVTGTHSILYRVQDASGAWSLPAFESLLVNPETCDFEIVVDDRDPGAARIGIGAWQPSGAPGAHGAGSLWARATTKVIPIFRFEADLPAGTYEVFEWHTRWSTRAQSVDHVIDDAGTGMQPTIVRVNQGVDGGRWSSLGTYSVSGRTSVTIFARDTVNSTNADAIRFVCRTR